MKIFSISLMLFLAFYIVGAMAEVTFLNTSEIEIEIEFTGEGYLDSFEFTEDMIRVNELTGEGSENADIVSPDYADTDTDNTDIE